jgi:Uma2 family endonuclease
MRIREDSLSHNGKRPFKYNVPVELSSRNNELETVFAIAIILNARLFRETSTMSALGTTSQAPFGTVTPSPVAEGPRPWKWTVGQYYKLGDLGFFQGKRVELIRGEILEMSPINWSQAVGTNNVSEVLRQIFAGQAWINTQNPLAMTDSHPQPDVAVISGRIRDYNDHPQSALQVVEVADTTLYFDTTTKAELYATAGVLDYWVLDLDGKRLLVFRDPIQLPTGLGASAYRTHFSLGPTETVSPLAAPNSTVTVSDLLP